VGDDAGVEPGGNYGSMGGGAEKVGKRGGVGVHTVGEERVAPTALEKGDTPPRKKGVAGIEEVEADSARWGDARARGRACWHSAGRRKGHGLCHGREVGQRNSHTTGGAGARNGATMWERVVGARLGDARATDTRRSAGAARLDSAGARDVAAVRGRSPRAR
jgi:hypothetical protein